MSGGSGHELGSKVNPLRARPLAAPGMPGARRKNEKRLPRIGCETVVIRFLLDFHDLAASRAAHLRGGRYADDGGCRNRTFLSRQIWKCFAVAEGFGHYGAGGPFARVRQCPTTATTATAWWEARCNDGGASSPRNHGHAARGWCLVPRVCAVCNDQRRLTESCCLMDVRGVGVGVVVVYKLCR